MKIQETRIKTGDGGFAVRVLETRVRELADKEELPEGATVVADDAAAHDWQVAV